MTDREAQLGIEPEEPDWDDEDPIIPEQPQTWIYWNQRGQLVLRQRLAAYYENEKPFLFFSVANLPALIRALQQKLVEIDHGNPGSRLKQQGIR